MTKTTNDNKKKSIGLIVFLTGKCEPVAVLLRRGRLEQAGGRYKSESYPGICQTTMHVKMTPEETSSNIKGLETAIERGVRKELGNGIWKELKTSGQLEKLHPLHTVDYENKTVMTFGATLSHQAFSKWVRTPFNTKKIFVYRQDVPKIEKIDPAKDKDMTIDEKTTVMFPDELEALKKGFATLCK